MVPPVPLSLAPSTPQLPEKAPDEGVVPDSSAGERGAPSWKVHDRTHIECGLDWTILPDEPKAELEWDAYFFVPESLRLDRRTYGKQEIYSDLRAYVRLAVPDAPFGELRGEPLTGLSRALRDAEPERAIYEMRFFACQVRAAAARARHQVLKRLGASDEVSRAGALAQAGALFEDAQRLMTDMRAVLAAAESIPDPAPAAARWVDEDLSRMIETFAGELSIALGKAEAPKPLQRSAERIAVEEARYRREQGLHGVAWAGIDKQDVEHLEFRRHVLKRFTASALWLQPKLRDPTRWVVHALYSLAAGVAMAFAVVAALWNGLDAAPDRLWMWGAIAVLAYMAKDRIKAWLQQVSSSVVSRRYPDRRWIVSHPDRGVELGRADERVDFVPFAGVPEDVLEVRRATRIHTLEEQARPETVLWHRKDVALSRDAIETVDSRVDAMREILRVDLSNWLAHTDDPKRRVVFADPDTGQICSAMAPRVYNVAIIYRLRRKGDDSAPWHRVRVVVTRKGIRRIDRIC